ncbi:MAG: serine/threonine-protein kinase [Sumerlaeia bacterium]
MSDPKNETKNKAIDLDQAETMEWERPTMVPDHGAPESHDDMPTRSISSTPMGPAEDPVEIHRQRHNIAHDVQKIGQYELLERVGKGAMGVVYKAQHVMLGRKVALKIMREDLASDDSFVKRFIREARIAASVDSPYVVTVYDAGNEGGFLYIAMKFVSGGELAALMKNNGGRIAADLATRLFLDCAQGLVDIHEAGLVHRDIKPSNILLTKTGSARIADLGLARAVQSGAKKSENLTMVGQAMGTPAYMPPEQVRGNEDVDIRADIYALGVTFYKALTGHSPFAGGSPFEVMAKVIYEEAPSPRDFCPEMPDRLVEILTKCMKKDRDERYQNPRELVEELTLFQNTSGFNRRPIPAGFQGGSTDDEASGSSVVASQKGSSTYQLQAKLLEGQREEEAEKTIAEQTNTRQSNIFKKISGLFKAIPTEPAPADKKKTPPPPDDPSESSRPGSSLFGKLSAVPRGPDDSSSYTGPASPLDDSASGTAGLGPKKSGGGKKKKKVRYYRGRRIED